MLAGKFGRNVAGSECLAWGIHSRSDASSFVSTSTQTGIMYVHSVSSIHSFDSNIFNMRSQCMRNTSSLDIYQHSQVLHVTKSTILEPVTLEAAAVD